MKATCEWCGMEFETEPAQYNSSKHHFCSSECWYTYRKAQTPKVLNVCPICGKTKQITKSEFEFNGGHVTCSKKCGGIWRRKRKTLTCVYCGKEFELPQSAKVRIHCSRECDLADRKRQRTRICPVCGKTYERSDAAMERVEHSFCSKDCYTAFNRGENSPVWKGGVSNELRRLRAGSKFKKWREAVYERDDYTCQICGKRGGYLHPHHIKPFAEYPDLRFDVDNGITLCTECHGKIHGITYHEPAVAGGTT